MKLYKKTLSDLCGDEWPAAMVGLIDKGFIQGIVEHEDYIEALPSAKAEVAEMFRTLSTSISDSPPRRTRYEI